MHACNLEIKENLIFFKDVWFIQSLARNYTVIKLNAPGCKKNVIPGECFLKAC